MSSSATRAGSYTTLYSKIIYVTRKVQADFLAILDTYGYFTEEIARGAVKDIRTFLDEEIISELLFTWRQAGSNRVLEELRYIVIAGIAVQVDDHSGGIRYKSELANANFEVRISFNQRWRNLDNDERDQIRGELECFWGDADSLDYSGGRWVSDRTYSTDSYGLTRKKFVR